MDAAAAQPNPYLPPLPPAPVPGSPDTLLPTPPAATFAPDPPLSASAAYAAGPANLVRPDPPPAATMEAPPPGDRVAGITQEMQDQYLQDVLGRSTPGIPTGALASLPAEPEERLQGLEAEIARLRDEVRQLQSHFGPSRVLVAKMDGTGTNRTMLEVVPTGGSNVQHLEVMPDGRQVFDGSIRPLIPIPAGSNRAVVQYLVGSNSAYVELPVQEVRFGKVQDVGACGAYADVKECTEDGTVFGTDLISVSPVKGGCDANGYCYNVGDIIAWLADPFNPGGGFQIGAQRLINVDYACTSGTNETFVKDLKRLMLNPADFHLENGADCPDSATNFTNRGTLYTRGALVRGYGGSSGSSVACGGFPGSTANVVSIGGVKVFDFDNTNGPPPSAAGTNFTNFPFVVSCASTSATIPPIAGGCGSDASAPMQATIKVQGRTGDIVYVSNVACNEDGTITVTTSRTTVVLPTT